HARSVSSIFA
ncbi:hypothetical protein ECCB7326_2996, partial [Escherichia coli CB7326]